MDKKQLLEVFRISEADFSDDTNARIKIIEEGFNVRKTRFYTAESLNKAAKLFEGKKMYINHESDWTTRERGARDLRDWVANIKTVEVALTSEGKTALYGNIVIHEPFFIDRLKKLRESKMLHELGVSINAYADGERKDVEGTTTNVINEFIEASSVDFVSEPGAGGRVENFKESIGGENDMDLKDLTIEKIKESRPDLMKAIEDKIKESIQPATQTQEPATKPETDDAELKMQSREARLDRKELLTDIIAASSLPANAKERVRESVLNSDVIMKDGRLDITKTKESISKTIESEENYIKDLTSAKVTEGNSGTQPQESQKVFESLQSSLDAWCGISVKEAK